MVQPYLLEWKKGSKWYLKLFKRLPSVAIHNTLIMYCSFPNNRNIAALKFRLSLARALCKDLVHSGVPCSVHSWPSVEPPPKNLQNPGVYSCRWKEMSDVHRTQEKERIYLLVQ
jgi:hypothetical protein